jgi:hypothetical protein
MLRGSLSSWSLGRQPLLRAQTTLPGPVHSLYAWSFNYLHICLMPSLTQVPAVPALQSFCSCGAVQADIPYNPILSIQGDQADVESSKVGLHILFLEVRKDMLIMVVESPR